MKFSRIITASLAALVAILSLSFTSCGNLPEKNKHVGPVSSESTIPWNRRLPGEGQGALGGLGRR